MPVGDAAYFTVRSRDVLTAHHPLLGAWSSGSSVVGVPVNNLGPLQLDLLAPFTKVAPYLGTGIGAALANAAARDGRVGGRPPTPRAVAGGGGDGGNPAARGDARAVVADRRPPAERTAAAAVRPVLARRGDGGRLGRGRADRRGSRQRDRADALHVRVPGAGAQRLRGGRLRRRHASAIATPLGAHGGLGRRRRRPLLDPAADRPAVGSRQPRRGARTGPPQPGRRRAARRRGGARRRRAHAAVVASRLVRHLPAALRRRVARRRRRRLRRVARPSPWHWPRGPATPAIGPWWRWRPPPRPPSSPRWWGPPSSRSRRSAWCRRTTTGSGPSGPSSRSRWWSGRARWRRWPARCAGRSAGAVVRAALVVVLVAVAAVAVWPRYPVRSVAEDENEAARIGRPLRAEMARAFSSGAVGDTVEVDLSRAFFGNNYPFVMLAELQNAGVEFRFAAGSGNLDRFGASRCVDPGRAPAAVPDRRQGSTARAGQRGAGQRRRHRRRRARRVRRPAGRVRRPPPRRRGDRRRRRGARHVRPGDRANSTTWPPCWRRRVVRRPDWRARWRRGSGGATCTSPPRWAPSFQRWFDLERRSSSDYQTVVLAPPGIDPTHQDPAARC